MRLAGVFALVVLAGGCGARSGLFGTETERDGGVTFEEGGVTPQEPPICLTFDGKGQTTIEVSFQMRIQSADILFLVDTTSSMLDEIGRIRDRLKDTLAPAITEEIRNVRFGVAYFGDFPVGEYGSPRDRPYVLLQEMTADLDKVERAVDSIPPMDGADGPESQTEALYQAATGEGLGAYVSADACKGTAVGSPCFRSGTTPVMLLFTDAAFHNGPGNDNPYSGIRPTPHTYPEAITVLRRIGARVIGLNSGGNFAARHLETLARDTGSSTADGVPLVFDIGFEGERLDERVIESLQRLAREVPIDVSGGTEDVPGDEINALLFVESLRPLRAVPSDGIAGIVDGTFRQARPGTTVVFELVLNEEAVTRQSQPREHWLRIVLVGEGGARLAERSVIIRIDGFDQQANCNDVGDTR